MKLVQVTSVHDSWLPLSVVQWRHPLINTHFYKHLCNASLCMFSCAVFESRDKIVIVMEYASRGELYDYIQERRRLPETEARSIFRQITSAVHYCHKVCTYTHRNTRTYKYTIGMQYKFEHHMPARAAVFNCAQANTVPLNPLNPNPAEKLDLRFSDLSGLRAH